MATFKTVMTDRALAVAAFHAAGLDHQANGTLLRFGRGDCNAVLDLETGLVHCVDSDEALVVRLRQLYAEAHLRKVCADQGITVETRDEDPNGDIVLRCSRPAPSPSGSRR